MRISAASFQHLEQSAVDLDIVVVGSTPWRGVQEIVVSSDSWLLFLLILAEEFLFEVGDLLCLLSLGCDGTHNEIELSIRYCPNIGEAVAAVCDDDLDLSARERRSRVRVLLYTAVTVIEIGEFDIDVKQFC